MAQAFQLTSGFKPAGDQPSAIKKLTAGIHRGLPRQTLLGVTGSGKTFTMANVIAKTQLPALVISHNKTLAAQLAEEFRQFFPHNAVEYFVSYYDYYQPEAYIPRTDTYIAKDSSINDEIDRLRHSAMEAVLTRKDVVVVASVSCIYGLGSPIEYLASRLSLQLGQTIPRRQILQQLARLHYQRNDTELTRGCFRVRGDIIDVHPAGEDRLLRVELFGSTVEKLTYLDSLTGQTLAAPSQAAIFPATFFLASPDQTKKALAAIREELEEQIQYFTRLGKQVEAQRLKQRTTYDLEMLEHIGYVSGVENYSRHLEGRSQGQPPSTLLDYFVFRFGASGFLTLIDESHMTVPQISAMHGGDRARKNSLIDYGFRLPSARDNRPLKFIEFEDRLGPTIFVSATPAQYEKEMSAATAEQIVRPTGLPDPAIEVRPTTNQIDDILHEIGDRIKKHQRILVTTLTKRMAEDLSTYLIEMGHKAAYIHADVETLERLEILRNLRAGTYDILIGINLLREGLDLPEVSLVIIMDADKEGYLRSGVTLIQTIGRAARHLEGKVIMYADKLTGSMKQALGETERRRHIQLAYNQEHHITPRSVVKAIPTTSFTGDVTTDELSKIPKELPLDERRRVINELKSKMELAARNLEFEKAAQLRDKIKQLRKNG